MTRVDKPTRVSATHYPLQYHAGDSGKTIPAGKTDFEFFDGGVAFIIIDKRPLFRDSMVRCLEATYPTCQTFSFASVSEWMGCPSAKALPNILILCVSENRTIDPDVRRELGRLAANSISPPAFIVSESENLTSLSAGLEQSWRECFSHVNHITTSQGRNVSKANRSSSTNKEEKAGILWSDPNFESQKLALRMAIQKTRAAKREEPQVKIGKTTATLRIRNTLRALHASRGADDSPHAGHRFAEILEGSSVEPNRSRLKGRTMIIPNGKLRVVVIDPRKFRCAALVQLLGAWADENGLELATVATPDSSDIGPDCAIVVLNVGGTSVREQEWQSLIKRIRTAAPDVPLAILSDRDDRDEILAAFGAGVTGFIATNFDPPLALDALSFLLRGGSFFPLTALLEDADHRLKLSDVAVTVDASYAATKSLKAPDPPPRSQIADQESQAVAQTNSVLTPRQSDVLKQLREGKSNKLIARELKMTEATVKVHVRQIMRKFGACNRTQVVLLATSALDQAATTIAE